MRFRNPRLCWNLLFLAASVSLWSVYSSFFPFHGPLKWGVAAFATVTACAIASKTVEITLPQPVLWLGTISYSLYLTHTTTQTLLRDCFTRNGWDTHNWGFMFLTTSVAVVAAWVFYEVVETRLCRRFRNAVEWSIAAVRGERAGARQGARSAMR